MATHIEIRGSLGVVRGLYVVGHIFITVKKQYSECSCKLLSKSLLKPNVGNIEVLIFI
jgi:hypothetical protein